MQRTKQNRSGLFLLPLLIVSAFAFLAPSVIPVRAATPPSFDVRCEQEQKSVAVSSVACTITPAGAGETFIMWYQDTNSFGGGVCPGAGQITVSSVAGGGASWTKRAQKQITGNCEDVEEWSATNLPAGATTVTATLSGTTNAAAGNYVIILVYAIIGTDVGAPFDPNVSVPGTQSGTVVGSATYGTLTITTSNAGDLLLGYCGLMELAGGNANNIVAPFTANGGGGDYAAGYLAESNTVAGQAVVCNRTAGGGTVDFIFISDALENSQATVVVIGVCNFFQLQCWWYPFLFMALYSGFLLMVASFVKASPKGKAHIFLSGLTFGSLIAVIFGIMNIVFPLLMLILNTIIVLRLR